MTAAPAPAAPAGVGRWASSPWLVLGIALVIAVLTWKPSIVSPGPGLDASWTLALHVAAEQGLNHGTELVFSYGPLGFLAEPSVAGETTALLSGLYQLLLRTLFAFSVVVLSRRSFGLPIAATLALVGAAIMPRSVLPLALAALWGLAAIQEPPEGRRRDLLLVAGGALAGIELLVKLNVGVAVAAIVAVAALGLGGRRGRDLALVAGSFTVVAVASWFGSGQELANVDDFLSTSFQIISGYSEAMQNENPRFWWDWIAAAVVIGATGGVVVVAMRGAPRGRRVAALLVFGILAFALFKQGFVRHDPGHVELFIGAIVAPWLALRLPGSGRWVAAAAVGLIALFSWPLASRDLPETIRPRLALEQLRALIDPGERDAVGEEAKAATRAAYGIDPRVIERIGDAPMHALPWESAIPWAYDLEWRPLPVFQDYTAYTPELDRANADAAASPDGPEYLLMHLDEELDLADLDGRYPPFDTPAATRAILCNFRPALQSGGYALLERAHGRCGPERSLEAVTAAYGEPVTVPRARDGEAVFASVEGLESAGLERLRSFAFRAATRTVAVDDAEYRIVGANAQAGLLLTAPRGFDLPAPFTLAPAAKTLRFETGGGPLADDGPLEVKFFAVPVKDR